MDLPLTIHLLEHHQEPSMNIAQIMDNVLLFFSFFFVNNLSSASGYV